MAALLGRKVQAGQVLRAALVVLAAVTFGPLTIGFAIHQPWLPGHFEDGEGTRLDYISATGEVWHDPVLVASGCGETALTLVETDTEPASDLFDPAAREQRLQRVTDVRCHLGAADARLTATDAEGKPQTMSATLRTRTLSDLDLRFWAPWLIGLVTLLMSGAVWILRPGEIATRLLAVNGLFLMISCMTIAAYTSHLPGAEPRLFWGVLAVNQIANQVFYLSLIGLFLQYPRRLLKHGWATPFLAVPFAGAVFLQWLPDAVAGLAIPAVELLAILALIGWQWVATRRDPRARAALMWLGLSVMVGALLWLCLLASILITGRTGDAGSILALIIVFPFYLGLVMGVARFCLVELQDWAFRILFFVVAALVFISFDAALITLLGLDRGPATGVALLLVAFAYLPLRDIIWRRLFKARTLSRPAMFAAVMDIVFAPLPSERAAKWQGLLSDLFQPLTVTPLAPAPAEAMIADEGLSLDVPAAAEGPALRLSLARGGRELFSPSQLALVRQLVVLVTTASRSRDAYERGAAEERLRLAQDLHDDVGASLMTALASADAQTRPRLHAVLGDIRAIAGGLAGKAAPLDRVLADIRQECVRRFEAAGLETEWPLWPEDAPLILVDYRRHKALASTLREIASNLIRHAGARQVTVHIHLDGDSLVVRVADDGRGFSAEALSGEQAGQGLTGLQRRMVDAGGSARFGNDDNNGRGAWIELSLPLQDTSA